LVVVILGSGTGWLVYGTGVLDIRSVSVEGSQTVPPEQVLAAAKVPLGTPLARLDTGGIRARVGALRPVAAVEVFRSWPHTVTVRIVERRPVAVVVQNSGYGLLDAEGVLYGSTSARPTGLPFVRLLDPGPGDRATRAVLAVVGVLTPELRHQLVEITAPTAEQVTLVLARGRSVFWGDAQDSSRKATVATALLARPGTRIDVSAADVVTVK
jgi:cell division protein FtsQ